MPRWKFVIEFDGTGFLGWQRQKRGRTVQKELESALSTFCRAEIEVMGQGRTDRGVHAEAQVAHADLPGITDSDRLMPALRGLLPADMAVIYAEQVADDFHARFDALSRRYRYQIATRPIPLSRHIYWVMLKQFDPDLLHLCADMVVGDHDFRNFAKEDVTDEKETRCVITISEWTNRDGIWIYRIEGNRFLRHMVRRIVGTMIRVATGKLTSDDFKILLDGTVVKRKGHAAPPEGLILERVKYE